MDEKRQAERVPVGLRVRLRFADMDAFVAGYAANLSRNGVFLEGVASRPVDTLVRFELMLTDGTVAMRGEGRVQWARDEGERRGIAVRFTRLDPRSKALVDELVSHARVGPHSFPPPPPAPPGPGPVHRPTPVVPVPNVRPLTRAPGPPEPPALAAAPPPPAPASAAPPTRASVEALDAELAELAGVLGERASPRSSAVARARPSLAEIDAELERLSSAAPLPPAAVAPRASSTTVAVRAPVSAPVAVPRPAPRPSVPPVNSPADYASLPPVLAAFGEPVEQPREPIVPPEPALPSSPPPEAMREPTPVPVSLEADMLEELEDDEAALPAIPQPPPVPRADVTASALGDELPNVDLEGMAEPESAAPALSAASTRAAEHGALGNRSRG